MKCTVIGAGNAGRPVARILNHAGNEVTITDQKKIEEFPDKVQKTLKKMEDEGVELKLGSNAPINFEKGEHVYISPTIPENAPIREFLSSEDTELITNEDVSREIDHLIDIDIIGVTGTLGKTSTTHTIAEIFETAGYKVWMCSSRMGNLLSEVIVDGIITGKPQENDVAVLELPHGTSRLMSQVHLKVGVLTNIYPEHLDEFDYSMDKYAARKLFIANSSETLVAGVQCSEFLKPLRNDTIFYCLKDTEEDAIELNAADENCDIPCSVYGCPSNGSITIYKDAPEESGKTGRVKFMAPFKLMSYYLENAVAAAAAALSYGIPEKSISTGLSHFHGVPGHMEYIGNYKGREVHFDAAFVPQGLINTLNVFSDKELVILMDNPDSTNPRDKNQIGEVLGRYADIMIVSGYNETTKKLDIKAAQEVIGGAEGSKAMKFAVEDMETAGDLSIKYSKPGDVILHVGPGAITSYEEVKSKMMRGIEEGCKKYE
jgi:UDP-N-acetylmuramoylalanine--D-glutamate ligase